MLLWIKHNLNDVNCLINVETRAGSYAQTAKLHVSSCFGYFKAYTAYSVCENKCKLGTVQADASFNHY